MHQLSLSLRRAKTIPRYVKSSTMMRALILLGTFALAGASIKDCDPASVFRPTALALYPDPPIRGESVAMTVVFDNPGPEVTEGTVKTAITLNGIPLSPSVEALCDDTVCPIVSGSNDRSTSSVWPDTVTGRISSKITWSGKNGESLLCIQTSVAVSEYGNTTMALIPYPFDLNAGKHEHPAPPAPHHSVKPPAPHHSDKPPAPHHSVKPPAPHHSVKPPAPHRPKPPAHSIEPTPTSAPIPPGSDTTGSGSTGSGSTGSGSTGSGSTGSGSSSSGNAQGPTININIQTIINGLLRRLSPGTTSSGTTSSGTTYLRH